MIVKPETFKKLVAIDMNNNIIDIPNMVLRKCSNIKDQDKNLSPNSICIVCNFRFLEQKIEFSNNIKAICHPFRDDSIFSKEIKKYLFSESDFCDKLITPVNIKMDKWNKEKYDFVYFTLISKEGTRSKGLYLLPLINEAAGQLKLKGLVVNYVVKETKKHEGTIYQKSLNKIKKQINSYKNLTIINEKFSTEEVCAIMNSVKFVLLPSDADASPRLIVESLVRDRPLVVNSSVYGGWKYIDKDNGSFFEAPTIEECYNENYKKDYREYLNNLIKSINEVLCIDNKKISNKFYEKYGFLNSSKKLANIIFEISGARYKFVVFKEWKKILKKGVINGHKR